MYSNMHCLSRTPKSRKDPAYALPDLSALLARINKMEEEESKSMRSVFSVKSDLYVTRVFLAFSNSTRHEGPHLT